MKERKNLKLFSESERLTFAKASQLPDMIDSECQQLKQMKIKLDKERYRKDKQFWLYYQVSDSFR